jgi:tRNA 2-thiouridine synthesizing protein B
MVNKSPFATTSLKSCAGHARAGDAILLLEDGVYGAISGTGAADILAGLGSDIAVFVLQPDLAARGLAEAELAPGLTMTDYSGFVDLAARHHATQSWL